jgi:serine/threonine protein kinase
MSSRTAVLGTRGGYGSLWAVHTEAERAAHLACRFSLERFGKYEILRELGRGAMGAVYQAHPLFTWMVSRVTGHL